MHFKRIQVMVVIFVDFCYSAALTCLKLLKHSHAIHQLWFESFAFPTNSQQRTNYFFPDILSSWIHRLLSILLYSLSCFLLFSFVYPITHNCKCPWFEGNESLSVIEKWKLDYRILRVLLTMCENILTYRSWYLNLKNQEWLNTNTEKLQPFLNK